MSETHRRRVVAKICTFVRVGLHTSRRRAADAPAPLERVPTSELMGTSNGSTFFRLSSSLAAKRPSFS